MQCAYIQKKLELFIDEELTEQDKKIVADHLKICAKCYQEFETLTLLNNVGKVQFSKEPHINYWQEMRKSIRLKIAEHEKKPSLLSSVLEKISSIFWPEHIAFRIATVAATAAVIFVIVRISGVDFQNKKRLMTSAKMDSMPTAVENERNTSDLLEELIRESKEERSQTEKSHSNEKLAKSSQAAKKEKKVERFNQASIRDAKERSKAQQQTALKPRLESKGSGTESRLDGILSGDDEKIVIAPGANAENKNHIGFNSVGIKSPEPSIGNKASLSTIEQSLAKKKQAPSVEQINENQKKLRSFQVESITSNFQSPSSKSFPQPFDSIYFQIQKTNSKEDKLKIWQQYVNSNPPLNDKREAIYEMSSILYDLTLEKKDRQFTENTVEFYDENKELFNEGEHQQEFNDKYEQLQKLLKDFE